MERFTGLIGVVLLLAVAYALSADRRRISPRIVVGGMLLQFVFAWLLIYSPPVVQAFTVFAAGLTKVISFAGEGTSFLFGRLADDRGPWGMVFAVKVLPVIIFFASLMSVLYHVGVMQRVVFVFAWIFRRTMNITGAEALVASANIFVGQTEAPLCIRPYLPRLTRSQIMLVMTAGFATIASSVMAAYIGILGGRDTATQILFARHLMTASLMSAPAAIVMGKIMLPELETPPPETPESLMEPAGTSNLMDAAAAGATDGLKLALNVAAMLVAFVALLALLNWPLTALGDWEPVRVWRETNGVPALTFQNLLGLVFKPVAWTIGVPWPDSAFVGSLLGKQLILTEFIAYLSLGDAMNAAPPRVGARAAQIATYALCGFANFPSIAIQIGGMSAMVPERRSEFASLGLRAMVAGALACWLTAAIASLFIPL